MKPITTQGRGMWKRQEEAVVSINGHMIRPVRTGARVLFTVDGTGHRFDTQDGAEFYAAAFLEPKHRKKLAGLCDVCGHYGADCIGDAS